MAEFTGIAGVAVAEKAVFAAGALAVGSISSGRCALTDRKISQN